MPDSLGCLLDFPVPEMGVAKRRADIGMTEQPRDQRHRHAVHHRVAGMGVAEVVKANVLDARLAPGAVPERKVAAAGPGEISRRRKDERASAARPAFENAPGRSVEGNDPGPRLAVGEDQPVAIDFRPAQPKDLAPAASGQKQEPDDVRLLSPAVAGLPVQDAMEPSDLFAGQKAREHPSRVPFHVPRRVGFEVTAGDREVHDLREKVERVIGIAGSSPAEPVEPCSDLRRGDAVERLRAEGGHELTGFDYDRVMLLHPDGKPRWFRPAGSIRYRLDVYETRPIEIRAGDRIRWTRNDKKRSLINGGRAEVEGIAKGRVRFRLADGRGLSLRMDDPQLRHIDHAWSSTVHGAQGRTAEGVIAVLDSSYGALTDQSTFYVEISRARDRAVVLTDNAEELVKVLADNTGERPTAIEAVDAPLELEPEEIVRLLAEEEPVWSPRAEWEALERRARREGTVLFLVDGYGELIGGARELAENPDLPALTREVVDGLLAYDRACREGDRAAVEFLGLLDAHDARRRGLDAAATTAERPVAGLEDYPEWREMSGRLSANGKVLLAALGGRAGEAGGTISERLGPLADLLAVDDAVLDFDTLRREVAARAAADGTTSFYAEGHGDLVERATNLAKTPHLPAWALAAVKEVLDQAEACKERKAEIFALNASAAGLRHERTKLEDRARMAGGSEFTPPTELEGYANWLVRCGEVGERWRAMREDPDTWQPHLDRLKDEEGKIAAAAARFDQLGDHDLAWTRVFQKRQTMVEREKAGNNISFYQQGWKELVEEARKLSQREGLPDQAGEMAQRVLDYDSRLTTERATVVGFLEDAEEHGQHRDALEEEAKRRARQDPEFLVTDLPGYRSLPDIPKKLLTTGRAIRKDEDTYAPHLDQIPDSQGDSALARTANGDTDAARSASGRIHQAARSGDLASSDRQHVQPPVRFRSGNRAGSEGVGRPVFRRPQHHDAGIRDSSGLPFDRTGRVVRQGQPLDPALHRLDAAQGLPHTRNRTSRRKSHGLRRAPEAGAEQDHRAQRSGGPCR